MGRVKIYNKLNRLMPVNFDNGESMHFLAKETKELTFEQFKSKEVQNYINMKYFIIISME